MVEEYVRIQLSKTQNTRQKNYHLTNEMTKKGTPKNDETNPFGDAQKLPQGIVMPASTPTVNDRPPGAKNRNIRANKAVCRAHSIHRSGGQAAIDTGLRLDVPPNKRAGRAPALLLVDFGCVPMR
jgi:hypothetical protein